MSTKDDRATHLQRQMRVCKDVSTLKSNDVLSSEIVKSVMVAYYIKQEIWFSGLKDPITATLMEKRFSESHKECDHRIVRCPRIVPFVLT